MLNGSHTPGGTLARWIFIPLNISSPAPTALPSNASRHSRNSPPHPVSVSRSSRSVCSFLSLAAGTADRRLTSALKTAPGRPPSASCLTCESTRPRAGITLESSKSAHVKLTEVFREPTQVSERGRLGARSGPDLHVKTLLMTRTSSDCFLECRLSNSGKNPLRRCGLGLLVQSLV